VLDAEKDVLDVAVGERRQIDMHVGDVDPLTRTQKAGIDQHAFDVRMVEPHHLHLDEAVVYHHAAAELQIAG
jgi:hypothetical protein